MGLILWNPSCPGSLASLFCGWEPGPEAFVPRTDLALERPSLSVCLARFKCLQWPAIGSEAGMWPCCHMALGHPGLHFTPSPPGWEEPCTLADRAPASSQALVSSQGLTRSGPTLGDQACGLPSDLRSSTGAGSPAIFTLEDDTELSQTKH